MHEASLLGRAGWDLELDLNPGGSFEEFPSNVISYGRRDQRWCTGDFLNSALILAPGFKTGQRVWLAYAMCSYAMSLVLVAVMALGFAMAARQGAVPIDATALCWAMIYMPLTQLNANSLLFWLHLDRGLPLWRQVASLVAEILARLVLTPLRVYQSVFTQSKPLLTIDAHRLAGPLKPIRVGDKVQKPTCPIFTVLWNRIPARDFSKRQAEKDKPA